jgi:hypothetical protein
MEQYLWDFCNYEQDSWFKLIPLAKFAYNNAVLVPTRMTPFWVNYHYHPVEQFTAPNQPSGLKSAIKPDTLAADFQETHQTLHNKLQKVQGSQRKYAGSREVVFEIGNKV